MRSTKFFPPLATDHPRLPPLPAWRSDLPKCAVANRCPGRRPQAAAWSAVLPAWCLAFESAAASMSASMASTSSISAVLCISGVSRCDMTRSALSARAGPGGVVATERLTPRNSPDALNRPVPSHTRLLHRRESAAFAHCVGYKLRLKHVYDTCLAQTAGGCTEVALGGRWHGGFDANAVPGASVGMSTGTVAATRQSGSGIEGGDVPGMRWGD